MGDRILKVNGTDVTKATHQEAVMELLRPGDEIKLTIQHDPLPDGYQVSVSFIINFYVITISQITEKEIYSKISITRKVSLINWNICNVSSLIIPNANAS